MKKTNNKGFSLVELIIVIAIMAILIGVLAPQYIKYVEKSRLSSDKDMIDSITKAVQTACTDEDYYDDLAAGNYVEITSTGITTDGGDETKGLCAAIDEYYGTTKGADSNKKFKSKTFKDVKIYVVISDGAPTDGVGLLRAEVHVGSTAGTTYNPSDY